MKPARESGRNARKCPACGSTRIARIVYGYLDGGVSLSPEWQRGEKVGGGCVISEDSPAQHCNDCGHRFGRLRW